MHLSVPGGPPRFNPRDYVVLVIYANIELNWISIITQ